jgi:thiol:disulfide interchange protein DsbD
MIKALARLVLLGLLTGLPVYAGAVDGAPEFKADFSHLAAGEPEFLPVHEAFKVDAEMAPDGSALVRFTMPDGYYLYRHRFNFQLRPDSGYRLGEAEIPPGKKKIDDYFGEVEVYYHEARIRVPVAVSAGAADTFELGVGYQGCADAGLCYPPETTWIALTGPATPAALAAVGSSTAPITQERALADLLGSGSLLKALLLFFVAGVGLAFTPCVLPMVPILSSIIVGQGESVSRVRAFTLSLAYVLGMAVTYALLGVLVGLFGASLNLQAALQSPPVLIGFAVVFVLLSLSMFGFYELRLPQALQDRLNNASSGRQGGRHGSVVVMGALSSLVVSPCVSAPLAGAVIYLSSTGDAVLGGSALLALGLGMGTPLILIGASGGHLLPRAGAWMETVKAVFGVLLLGVAVWLLERVVPAGVTLLLWAALAIGAGVYMGALDFSPRRGWGQLWKATGAFSFIYGVLLLIGAASGAQNPLAPLSEFAARDVAAGAATSVVQHGQWQTVKGTTGLDVALAEAVAAGQPAVLDFYADWCISCKVMERSVFPDPAVAANLARFKLLRADVTANDADDKALLERYALFGPPSLVFFDANGDELPEYKIQGEIDRVRFTDHLGALVAHLGIRAGGSPAGQLARH